MNSSINLFIYEVLGPKIRHNSNYNKKYSFGPLSLRKNSDNITPIIPKNLELKNRLSNKNKLFSPNIIKNITVINTPTKKKSFSFNKFISSILSATKSKNTNSKRSKDNINLHKNKELEINFNNIPFLYKIYKTFPARISLEKIFSSNFNIKKEDFHENIYKKIPQLIKDNSIIFHKYFIDNTNNYEIKNNDCEIIYNLYENDDSNIIIIGDNHGSFHSFFRIILRLYIQGIITSGYKLKKNYKLILLGDLVDRGNYAVELLYILLNLMKTNNTESELKVILIRGNHEVPYTYHTYGFYKEYMKKIPEIDKYINIFFKYCPSAILLNHLKTRYWLCHGGFSTNIKDYKKLKKINNTEIFVNELLIKKNTNNNNNRNVNNKNTVINDKKTDVIISSQNTDIINSQNTGVINSQNTGIINSQNTGIINDKNTDIINSQNTDIINDKNTGIINSQNTGIINDKNTVFNNWTINNNIKTINNSRNTSTKYTASYIRWNDFSGNNEDEPSKRNDYRGDLKKIGNATLKSFLNEYNIDFIIRGHTDNDSNAMLLMENNGRIFFHLNNKSNMEYYEKEKNNKNNKNSIIKYKNIIKSNTEILSIYPKEFNKNSVNIGKFKLFPVLTISNNCDNDRSQYSDSFIIICKPSITAFINNNNDKTSRNSFTII